MRKFFIGILSIWLVILLLVFGVVSNINTILVDTTDQYVKKEIKENIVDTIKEYSDDSLSDKTIARIEQEIGESEAIKSLIDKSFEDILDVLTDKKENINIDIKKEMETLLDEAEIILKDYDVKLSKKEKKKMLDSLLTEEVNKVLNEEIKDMKDSAGNEVKTAIHTYSFITGPSFKIILIGCMVFALVLIALLKKSYYRWLSALASSLIAAGIALGYVVPMSIEQLLKTMDTENAFVISTASLSDYGYILLILGAIALLMNIVFVFVFKKKKEAPVLKKEKDVEQPKEEDTKTNKEPKKVEDKKEKKETKKVEDKKETKKDKKSNQTKQTKKK